MNTFNRKQKHARQDSKKKYQLARKTAGVAKAHTKAAALVGGNTSGKSKTKQKRAQKRATSLLLQASSDMDTQEPAASRMPKNLRAAKAVAMKE
mmetsp:Transcript_38613/g.74003  ORF Transcript_38613/g.74003 Transcript_38613/m.74003 type:complete len:94 (-) Transcript_38613:262-543(-)